MSQAWGGAAVVTPNQESVKEIRVTRAVTPPSSAATPARRSRWFLRTAQTTFHGSAVFKRNTPGLNTYQTVGRPAQREAPQRVNQRLSQTAASIGGPIQAGTSLFFFFSYETSRGTARTSGTEWVETPEFVAAIKAPAPEQHRGADVRRPGMTPPRIANVLERAATSGR